MNCPRSVRSTSAWSWMMGWWRTISSSALSATSNYCMTGGKGNICHGFMAINPAFFGDPAAIKEHFSTYLQELRESPKADGQERIYTHGEKEVAAIADRKANGIPVNDNTMVEVYEMCQYLGMDFSKYFGSYIPEKSAGFKSPETFK